MHKIAVIGERNTIIGFKALGFETHEVLDAQEARKAFAALTEQDSETAIIYIEEKYVEDLKPNIDQFKESPVPAIIAIPGSKGSTGAGIAALREASLRAVGMDLMIPGS